MYISSVSIENFRAFKEKTVFHFNPGVTVLIGENDCGKSTVIDAIRYVLGTTDQSWQRVEYLIIIKKIPIMKYILLLHFQT